MSYVPVSPAGSPEPVTFGPAVSAPSTGASKSFHPAVQLWFERRFPHGPTEAQTAGWPAIEAGSHTLIAAPTGSGKTLAAFLVCIDRLYRAAEAGTLGPPATHVVYVSPLKALAVDIQQNLARPLAEIREVALELGLTPPDIEVAVRTGDTPAARRAAMLKRPPHLLITTPESLYLLLGAPRSREMLRSAVTLIVDEIHALARDKRGVHLSLSLERLRHICHAAPVRIGLSATQRPLARVARLLVGADEHCTLVDVGHQRTLDLAIELPRSELAAVASNEQMGEVLDRLAELAKQRQTTLVFVNTRRLAERLAHQLQERLGDDQVAAHHGSLSKERRLSIEARLRAGSMRAVVATGSLELGIDIGPVELVCQIGSPRSIATLLQRVGRSGHSRFGVPMGRLYPLTRDELVECTALVRAVHQGRLDAVTVPHMPLDILAQQVVAECAVEAWQEDALFACLRRAAPYANLARSDFDAVVSLVSEGILTGRGRRAAYLQRDRVTDQLKGRRGARLAALTSGGAIPETADYRVLAEPDETFVGTINEDFAIESMAGDVFLLGSTSWRIRRVESGVVRVIDAEGATPTVPFWLGEAPARTLELSEEVSNLRRELAAQLNQGDAISATAWLQAWAGVEAPVAREVVRYLDAARTALGVLPCQHDIVFERFFDETGGMQLVVHSPFGGRFNRALGLLLRKRFCTSFDFELQAAASDDAVVLSLGPQHSFPLEDVPGFLRPTGVREALVRAVIVTPMFAVRWRWNLNRALIVLRFKGGKKNPPPLQRMQSDDVMVAVFPSLAACQDNATGPREIPDHLLVRQTLYDCLHEAMDIEGLERVLADLRAGRIRAHFRDTTEPSPLAHEILNSRPYTFLDDAPLEERRTRAVQVRRGLPVEARALAMLDPAAIDRVRAEASPQPRDADELHDWLSWLGTCRARAEWHAWFESLVAEGRAGLLETAQGSLWYTTEKRRALAALFPQGHFLPDAPLPPSLLAMAVPDAEVTACDVVRGHLDVMGPTTAPQLADGTGLALPTVEAALARLEVEGVALRGHFDAELGAAGLGAAQYCARRLLVRIHTYTTARLRKEIEPVTPQTLMRFLLRWQHVAPGSQLTGPRGVVRVVEQLQGFELAATAWENHVLRARVQGYRSEWLDSLCLSGRLSWGRLSVRAAVLSRATPITLGLRGDWPWLLQATRSDKGPSAAAQQETTQVVECLRNRGALFFDELAAHTGLGPTALHEALWEGVGRGLLTADGFQTLRNLLVPASRRHRLREMGSGRSSLRQGATGSVPSEGRWALLPVHVEASDGDALAEAVAEQLLARWGIVFRDIVRHESIGISWREVLWALRRLEARGTIRGGRFVTGFVGEQYALPEAIAQLRRVRHDATGTTVRLSACDPLNLIGTILPGTRVPAVRTRFVRYRDGAALTEDPPNTGTADASIDGVATPAILPTTCPRTDASCLPGATAPGPHAEPRESTFGSPPGR